MSKSKNKIFKWFGKKFQLIVYHGNSYDIMRKFKFNRLGFMSINFLVLMLVFAILSVLVIFTPIKQLIPGYPDKETRLLIYENSIRTDSLIRELEIRDQYLEMIREMVFNDVPIDSEFVVPVQNLSKEQIKEFNNPANKRVKVEDKTSLTVDKNEVMPELFPPVKGIVKSKYNLATGHYGTDIASYGETTILSTLRGTVLFSDYTVETGYTIIIQHKSNLISVYKHNKSSFVEEGQFVETGQAIAIYGNTGENTNGEHLHFELWRNGVSLNPEDYIEF